MEKKMRKEIKVLLCILIALVALGFCIRVYNHIWERQYDIAMPETGFLMSVDCPGCWRSTPTPFWGPWPADASGDSVHTTMNLLDIPIGTADRLWMDCLIHPWLLKWFLHLPAASLPNRVHHMTAILRLCAPSDAVPGKTFCTRSNA